LEITCPFVTGHFQLVVQGVEPGRPWHSGSSEERLRLSSITSDVMNSFNYNENFLMCTWNL